MMATRRELERYIGYSRAMTGHTQQLYLVFGGALVDPTGDEYGDPNHLDIRGIFDTYDAAHEEWTRASFQAADDALVRYRIVALF